MAHCVPIFHLCFSILDLDITWWRVEGSVEFHFVSRLSNETSLIKKPNPRFDSYSLEERFAPYALLRAHIQRILRIRSIVAQRLPTLRHISPNRLQPRNFAICCISTLFPLGRVWCFFRPFSIYFVICFLTYVHVLRVHLKSFNSHATNKLCKNCRSEVDYFLDGFQFSGLEFQ